MVAAKISSFEFQYLHTPLVILNVLSLIFFFVGWEGKGQQICIHFHTLLKCVTIILLCIAGEATCTIVHKQEPQMNTSVPTTAQ